MDVINEQFVTVAKAAELLKVSTSTLWRWIRDGDISAYRFGHRRVLIKQMDLDRLITPARGKKGGAMRELEKERERLSRPLTEAEKQQALAALESARRFKAELLASRGGEPFSDSVEIMRQMRD